MRDTGLVSQDVQTDYERLRRRRIGAQLLALVARRRNPARLALSFDEVIGQLGYRGERELGYRVINLDEIIGSVDKVGHFDQKFRPTRKPDRRRFEMIAGLMRRGHELPPIEVYQIGPAYFVRDGHHRVSAARAQAWGKIEAHVIEVLTGGTLER